MLEGLFTINGVFICLIIALTLIAVVVLILVFGKNIKVKAGDVEIARQVQEQHIDTTLKQSEQLSSFINLEISKRVRDLCFQKINSLCDEVYALVYSSNTEIINSTASENTVQLLIRYILSSCVSIVDGWILSNNIGTTPQEQEKYIDARSKHLLYYLRVFINMNESVLPIGINMEAGFNEKYTNGLLDYIREHFKDLLETCMELKSTVHKTNESNLVKSMLMPPTMGTI